jgi:hypothetical protein
MLIGYRRDAWDASPIDRWEPAGSWSEHPRSNAITGALSIVIPAKAGATRKHAPE